MAEHTPGPWRFRLWGHEPEDVEQMRKHGIEPIRILTNDGQIALMGPDQRIALVDCQTPFKRGQGYKTDCAERDANAALIAAAPELLAAARAAVAALESERSTPNGGAEVMLRAAIAKATNPQPE